MKTILLLIIIIGLFLGALHFIFPIPKVKKPDWVKHTFTTEHEGKTYESVGWARGSRADEMGDLYKLTDTAPPEIYYRNELGEDIKYIPENN